MSAVARNILIAAMLALATSAWAQEPQAAEPAEPAEQPAAPAPPQPQPQPPRGESRTPITSSQGWQPYRVIVDRNIFSRQRGRGGPGASEENGGENGTQQQAKQTDVAPGPPPEPGTQVVLIGVSFVGDYATAVFEDRRDGAIYAAQVGEKLVDRTIQNITLDTVEVDHEGKTIEVVIGRTLAGTEAPVTAAPGTSAAAATGGSTTPGATTPASGGDPATQSILERLRARREEQLKK